MIGQLRPSLMYRHKNFEFGTTPNVCFQALHHCPAMTAMGAKRR
jgi:hypothetical protein